MEYILKVTKDGTHMITDYDLDEIVQSLDLNVAGKTLREAVRVDLNDSLGWKKSGYHPEMIRQKLIFKYQSEAINAETTP